MFDGIRPYTPEELPGVIDELFDDPQFLDVVHLWYKDVPTESLRQQAKACKNNLEVQEKLFYPLVMQLMNTCAASLTLGYPEKTDKKARHTYVSNHRDIVLDSALLSILLLSNGFGNTVEIAIGDNLLIYPWIEKLVRVNKSFVVRRSVSMREKLESSRLMSEYMHFAIAEKHENIWIAQREGRAKDSDDRTQESVLKMMAMGGTGTPAERLMRLNIVPLSISYEYDPCDYLKAKEFQLKRDNPDYAKSRADDLENMRVGIFGCKGHVHYEMARPINTWLPELAELPKATLFRETAARIDKEIHRGYHLYPGNYVAADLLDGGQSHADHYTAAERQLFEEYVASRVALVDLPRRDDNFLRERILTMYANPLLNHQAARG